MRELVRYYIHFKWEFDLQVLTFTEQRCIFTAMNRNHCHYLNKTHALPSVFYNLNSISIGVLNTLLLLVLLLLLLLLLSHLSHVWLYATPSLGFSRQEHWSGLLFPSPMHKSEKWKWSRSVMSDSSRPYGLQPTRLLCPWDFPGKSTGVGCHCLLY